MDTDTYFPVILQNNTANTVPNYHDVGLGRMFPEMFMVAQAPGGILIYGESQERTHNIGF